MFLLSGKIEVQVKVDVTINIGNIAKLQNAYSEYLLNSKEIDCRQVDVQVLQKEISR